MQRVFILGHVSTEATEHSIGVTSHIIEWFTLNVFDSFALLKDILEISVVVT